MRNHIIIDDGSHINEHVITSFNTLFPYLKDGGIYIIEDLQTAYLPHYGGNAENLDEQNTSINMLKRLVDGLNYKFIHNRIPSYFDENIVSVHFYPKLAVILKGKNQYFS